MINKKAYSNPELSMIAMENTDVVMISSNPSVGDVSWSSDVLGGNNNESL